jgi:hypothetical protein
MATRPNITKLADDIEYWNILISADSGAGKTVLAGSDTKVLFIAPEDKGLISSKRINKTANSDKITVAQWEDLMNAYEWYDENPEELKDFNVLVIDSLTEMQYLAKNYVLRMTAEEKRRKNQDPKKMQIQDYGMMHDCVESLVRGFNDLQVNVLYTATAKQVKDPDENPFIVPELTGKGDYGFAMKMVALMTSYGYMRVETVDVPAPTEENPQAYKKIKRRVVYFEDTGTIRGKDRTVTLAPFVVNPTMQKIRRCIAGEMKRDSDGQIVKLGTVAKKASAKATPPNVEKADPQPSPQPEGNVGSSEAPESDTNSEPITPASTVNEAKEDAPAELEAVDA